MIYISPPFGNYISLQDTVSIKGTFTYHRRKGLIYNTLRSLRPVRGGWRNQIGFRNKGIHSVDFTELADLYSICGLNEFEWTSMLSHIPEYTQLELNLSCPNVPTISISDETMQAYCEKFPDLIAKVRYDIPNSEVDKLVDMGVERIHCSNTIPTDKGGISGRQLKELNLPNIERISERTPRVIAGGGIYDPMDIVQYRNAGAKDFSLSTIFISKPWNVKRCLTYRTEYV
jgi:dihydroorotate dehydrogenase